MHPYTGPDRHIRVTGFEERDSLARSRIRKRRDPYNVRLGTESIRANACVAPPQEVATLLYLPAGNDLQQSRLIGDLDVYGEPLRHGPQITNMNLSETASEDIIIPPAGGECHVNTKVLPAGTSLIPFLQIGVSIKYRDYTSFGAKKDTYADAFLGSQAVATPVKYESLRQGAPTPAMFAGLHQLQGRVRHDGLALVSLDIKGGEASGSNLFASSSFGPFDPEMQDLRIRLQSGGVIVLIVKAARLSIETIRGLESDFDKVLPGHALDHFFMGLKSDLSSKLDVNTIQERTTRRSGLLTLSPVVTYPTVREGVIAELVGIHREHEWIKKSTEQFLNRSARFAEIPDETERRRLIMFVERDGAQPLNLKLSDELAISIHALNQGSGVDSDWTGRIVSGVAGAPRNMITIIIQQPRNKDTGGWVGGDAATLSDVIDLLSQPLNADLARVIGAANKHSVDIRVCADDHAFKTRVETLLALDDMARGRQPKPSICELFTASHLDRLHSVNVVEELRLTDSTIADVSDHLDTEQNDVLRLLRSALGGVVCIESPAGSGKTHINVTLAAALVKQRHLEASKDDPRPGARVLVVSPTNSNIEKLLKQFDEKCCAASPDAIVVRAFNDKVNRMIAERGLTAMQNARDPSLDDALPLATRILHHSLFSDATGDLIGDHRVTDLGLEMSAAKWVMCACREAVNAESPTAKQSATARLRATIPKGLRQRVLSAYRGLQIAARSDAGEKHDFAAAQKDFADALSSAYPYLYAAADVIIGTPIMVTSTENKVLCKPELVFVEEAMSLTAADSLCFVRFPTAKGVILSGDPHQLGPRLISEAVFNELATQATTPFLMRLIAAGFPTLRIKTQRRYCEQLSEMFNDLYYKYDYLAPHVNAPKPGILNKAFEEVPPWQSVAVVDVRGSEEEQAEGSTSRQNLWTCAATWDVIRKLQSKGVKDARVVTPYQSQVNLHKSIVNNAPHLRIGDVSTIEISTVELAQGSESDVVILDIPNTKNPGFLDEAGRLLTAASRARRGLILVADLEKAQSWDGGVALNRLIVAVKDTQSAPGINLKPVILKHHWTRPFLPQSSERNHKSREA